jgi:hypothetical protein
MHTKVDIDDRKNIVKYSDILFRKVLSIDIPLAIF